jgi:hypothetical protein
MDPIYHSPAHLSSPGDTRRYPSVPPHPPPPPPPLGNWAINSASRYYSPIYSSSPRDIGRHIPPRPIPQRNDSTFLPSLPPPPPPSHSNNDFSRYRSPADPSFPEEIVRHPSRASFTEKVYYLSPPPPPPPPPSFHERSSYPSLPPRSPSPPSLEEETDFISPALNTPTPSSNNDPSSPKSNSSLDTGLGSFTLNAVGTLISTTSLGLAFRQDARSNAQLQLATAVALKEMVAEHGVHGTGVIINDGFWTTIEQARTVAELVATGGTVVLSAAKSRAGSLVGGGQRRLGATSEWVASSAASIRSRLPSISFYGRSTFSLTENPWLSAQNEDPPSAGAFGEEDHG